MMLGFTWAKGNDGDSVFGGALAVGYDFYKKIQVPLRAELEYAAFSQAEGKSSETSYYDDVIFGKGSITQKLGVQTLFLNVYYDFRNSTAFTPYLGAGLGLAFLRAKGQQDWWNYYDGVLDESGTFKLGAKTSTNFAWNIGAGLAYDFTDYFSLDLNYRFAGLGKAKTADVEGGGWRIKADNVYMHQVLLAFRFTF